MILWTSVLCSLARARAKLQVLGHAIDAGRKSTGPKIASIGKALATSVAELAILLLRARAEAKEKMLVRKVVRMDHHVFRVARAKVKARVKARMAAMT